MGANAQTSVPTFTAGQVLTAAQMNTSARTGVPVFADASARDAGFGGTGEKTLAEGQLAYLEDLDVVQYYDGSSWATLGPISAGGMTLISTTTLSGASVSLSSIPGTYKHLQLVVRNYLPATDNQGLAMRVNGDSTPSRHFSSNANSGSSSFNANLWSTNAIGQDNGGSNSLIIWDLYDYANTTTWKTARSHMATNNTTTTTNVNFEIATYYYNQTGAITSLDLFAYSGNFTSGTVLLYGIS
jgi:hypothetical protein